MDQHERIEIPAWVMHPEHAKAIGGALWVLLFLWQRADDQGRVFEGQAVPLDLVAGRLEISVRSVKRQLKVLRDGGYIDTRKCPAGGVFIAVQPGAKSGPKPETLGPNSAPSHQENSETEDPGAKSGPTSNTLGPNLAPGSLAESEKQGPGAKSGPKESHPPYESPLKGTKDLSLDLLLRPTTATYGEFSEVQAAATPGGEYAVQKLACGSGSPLPDSDSTDSRSDSTGDPQAQEMRQGALWQSPECTPPDQSNPSSQNQPHPPKQRGCEGLKPACLPGEGNHAPGLDTAAVARRRVEAVLARIDEAERPEVTQRLLGTLGKLGNRWLTLAQDACWEAWRKRGARLNDAPAWWHAMLERKAKQALKMQAEEEHET